MTWNNYPSEIKCPSCDGTIECECDYCGGLGRTECSCCGSTIDCEECRNIGHVPCEDCYEGKVGLDVKAFEEAVKDYLQGPGGTYELIEDGLWVGRAARIGEEELERKLYYLDFTIEAVNARQGKLPYKKPNPKQKKLF